MSNSSANQSRNTAVTNNTPSINLENTAISEYLEIIQSEYDLERNKKESFINREGILLALSGAVVVMIFDKIDISQLISKCSSPLTFVEFWNILSGFGVYVGCIVSIIFSLITISTSRLNNFEVKNINEQLLFEERKDALKRLIYTYRDIIIQHRQENKRKSLFFRISLISLVCSFAMIIIYYLT